MKVVDTILVQLYILIYKIRFKQNTCYNKLSYNVYSIYFYCLILIIIIRYIHRFIIFRLHYNLY